MRRAWNRAELEQSLAWLKRMNARGNDIFIRPAELHGFVLVGKLSRVALAHMKKEGFSPAATIEISPGNFQAWVKLSDTPLSAETRRIAATGLAERYGGSTVNGYGRLAGFTNQKPEFTRDGHQPYVLAHNCLGRIATAAPAYLSRIAQSLNPAPAESHTERSTEDRDRGRDEKTSGAEEHEQMKGATRQAPRNRTPGQSH